MADRTFVLVADGGIGGVGRQEGQICLRKVLDVWFGGSERSDNWLCWREGVVMLVEGAVFVPDPDDGVGEDGNVFLVLGVLPAVLSAVCAVVTDLC